MGYINSPDDIRRIVLKTRDGTPVTVGDVAEIVQSNTPRRGAIGYNEQKEAVEGFVLMRRAENPSRVMDGVHAKVKELNERILPQGMKIETFYDRTLLVGTTLKTVNNNLLHGFLLVVAVAWLFFRSVTGSLIVGAVIPLALLGAFIGLYALKLPANLISMGAIDFGILVTARWCWSRTCCTRCSTSGRPSAPTCCASSSAPPSRWRSRRCSRC
jgi:cobalt-zinc-cadmium resistance protein CzcA